MKRLTIVEKRTNELTPNEKSLIISLKQQHWGYTVKEQKRWLEQNIRDDDFHFLIRQNGKLLGYANVVNVEVIINHSRYWMLGVGNVCVKKQAEHLGIGSLLMACVNSLIRETALCGVLLCKAALVPFYQKASWRVIRPKKVTIKGEDFSHVVMLCDPKGVIGIIDNNAQIDFCRNF